MNFNKKKRVKILLGSIEKISKLKGCPEVWVVQTYLNFDCTLIIKY
jgi:hypothetical protein